MKKEMVFLTIGVFLFAGNIFAADNNLPANTVVQELPEASPSAPPIGNQNTTAESQKGTPEKRVVNSEDKSAAQASLNARLILSGPRPVLSLKP